MMYRCHSIQPVQCLFDKKVTKIYIRSSCRNSRAHGLVMLINIMKKSYGTEAKSVLIFTGKMFGLNGLSSKNLFGLSLPHLKPD